MKKLCLAIAAVALMGWTVSTFADVQNIRLSGDVRIRGYYLSDVGVNGDGNQTDTSFISQRTRVTVEADLEDHVLVVVTLKAEGLWGADNEAVHGSSGAGATGFNGQVNRGFDVGIDEAYVQLNEVFYTPATLKLGRQYLNYGHGLILSSAEQEYNYDAARLVLDYYPLVIDLVGAKMDSTAQSFASASEHGGSDLLFINARYELTDSVIKNVEGYFGYLAHGDAGPVFNSRIPPTAIGPFGTGSSPWIVGLRTDLAPTDKLQLWAEAAYEGGSDGIGPTESIEAWIANLGARFTMKDTTWSPAINANYIYASGGGKDAKNYFRPWFDYGDGYNGYVFHPALTDIHIFNVGASVKPYENTTLSLQAYYYMKADSDGFATSNGNADYGSTGIFAAGTSRDIGWEIDGILGYDYSKDVRCQLVYGAFIPGRDVHHFSNYDQVAQELRGEVNVKF